MTRDEAVAAVASALGNQDDADRLVAALKALGMRFDDVASETGVAPSAVDQILSPQPYQSTLNAIAEERYQREQIIVAARSKRIEESK
jgi:transcriptional regulator with XRE-family HTH domain